MRPEHSFRERRLIRTFVELADTLTDNYDLSDFLHRLLMHCTGLCGVPAAGLLLRNTHGGVELLASSSERSEDVELFQLQNRDGPCLDCIGAGEPVRSGDLTVDTDRWPVWAPVALNAGFRSVYATPLKLRAQVIGAVNLFAATPHALTDDDLAVVRALADIATIGILQERAIRQRGTVSGQLQRALSSRVLIEQAKGIIAGRSDADMSMDRAFLLLRDYARRTETTIAAVAEAIVDGTLDPARLTQHAARWTM